ncbi:MAG: PIN domain-containing protein [Verrucomicrobiota bacterium]|nr:PIN domain-containing protein [Verrucomicrobiota bacterium]
MVLVDSSVWIDALRHSGPAGIRQRLQTLLEAGEAAWCAAIRLELWPGTRDGRERGILVQYQSIVADLPVTEGVWAHAIDLAERARKRGMSCPYPDLLIHACATVNGVELLHRDKHFDQLASL